MAISDGNLSAADVAAVTNGGGFGGYGGDGWWLILLFLFAFGGWGSGVPYVANDVQRGFDQSAVMSGISGIQTSLSNGFANSEISQCNQTANLTGQLSALALNQATGTCGVNSNIADLKYTVSTEACADRAAVTDALQAVTNAINDGIQSVKDQLFSDKLDANVEFVSASDGGSCAGEDEEGAGGIVTWSLKDVAAGASGKVTLTVKVLEGALESEGGPGKVVNGGKDAWVQVGNDAIFRLNVVENPVEETPEPVDPEKPVKREISPYEGTGKLGSVEVDDEITYEITYRNYLTEDADVVIKDKLDPNVEFVDASDEGEYDEDTHTVTWTLEEVPAGESGSVTLTVKVLKGALESKGGPGKVVNGGKTATVKIGDEPEYTLGRVENPVEEPDEPTKPDKPDKPGKPDKPTPTTGDDTPLGLLWLFMAISVIGSFSIATLRIRGNRRRSAKKINKN